jgi:5'-3' exonuclease
LPALGDYLTNGDGGLNFTKVDILLHDLSKTEEEFFKLHKKNADRNENFRKKDELND